MATRKNGLRATEVLLIIAIGLGLILLSPILIPLLIYAFAKNKYEAASLSRFLRKNEGATYFCFTNKITGLAFIREKILPHLDPDVQIIYMKRVV